MDFIDNNIMLGNEKMSRGIYATSGYSDMDYNKFMSIFTSGKITLNSYIRKRRLYFAAKELVECNDITVCGKDFKVVIDITDKKVHSNTLSDRKARYAALGYTAIQIIVDDVKIGYVGERYDLHFPVK